MSLDAASPLVVSVAGRPPRSCYGWLVSVVALKLILTVVVTGRSGLTFPSGKEHSRMPSGFTVQGRYETGVVSVGGRDLDAAFYPLMVHPRVTALSEL